jgi:ribose transport system ATP-binding protein
VRHARQKSRPPGSVGGPQGGAKVLEIDHLSKSFGSNRALKEASLTINPGEFLGLVGPNGSGKSTLLKILAGLYRPDSGRILLGGTPVPSLGRRADVAFIHQDLGLVDTMSVSDNLRLGQPAVGRIGPFLNRRREVEVAVTSLSAAGVSVSPKTSVGELSAAEKTLVAVARALARGASIFFIDEATSNLTRKDAGRVIHSLEALAARGCSIVYVTHKFAELLLGVRKVAFLIDGALSAPESIEALDVPMIVRRLAGRDLVDGGSAEAVDVATLEPVLSVRHGAYGKIRDANLEVRAGEVLGLTGEPDSGLYDVAFLAAGYARLKSGSVKVSSGTSCALIPPFRETQGGFTQLSVLENMTISSLARWSTVAGTFISSARERQAVGNMIQRLSILPGNPQHEFRVLSGGNKQKVIFGRAILRNPALYVLCEPTRGVDVMARADIYAAIRALAQAGGAVLIATSDYEDLISVCHRVGIVSEGILTEILDRREMGTAQWLEVL